MKHLAIFIGDAIEKILKGEKIIEGRFTIDKIPPYLVVSKGDIIFLKQSGEKIIGQAEVENVLFYEGLTGESIGKLRKEYSKEMCVSDIFWQEKVNSKYASIIFLTNPTRFLAPIKNKKKDRRSWVLLGNG